jgi:hypothetical protein
MGWRERSAWNDLAFRLIDPIKLAIIEAVLQLERPLAVRDLAAILDISADRTRYHCKGLTAVEVLEVAEVQLRLGSSGSGEPFFDLPPPERGLSPSPVPSP